MYPFQQCSKNTPCKEFEDFNPTIRLTVRYQLLVGRHVSHHLRAELNE